VFENEHWIVRHSSETNIAGYVLIESRRHFLDMAEATAAEAASYGEVLAATMAAVREVAQPERVYTFSLAEAVPHYHLHVIPRRADFPRAYRARGIMQYPLQPAVDDSICELTCERLRRAFRTRLTSACP
jgi:diadenosine tetraphosphate (Ap4A) HIT family hydrolase